MGSITHPLSNDFPSIDYTSLQFPVIFFLNVFPVIKIYVNGS